MSEKKPFLFYWEEAYDSWVPVPDQVENMIDVEGFMDGEEQELKFKCLFMTDEEYDNLPEV